MLFDSNEMRPQPTVGWNGLQPKEPLSWGKWSHLITLFQNFSKKMLTIVLLMYILYDAEG